MPDSVTADALATCRARRSCAGRGHDRRSGAARRHAARPHPRCHSSTRSASRRSSRKRTRRGGERRQRVGTPTSSSGLDHARGPCGRLRRCARRHQPDELTRARSSRPRAAASATTRSTISCSGVASKSSTFVETWTRPRAERRAERLHAGQPAGRLAHGRRDGRGRPRASPQLDVEGDERRPDADAARRPPRGRAARAEVGRELTRVDARAAAPRGRRAGRTRAGARPPSSP